MTVHALNEYQPNFIRLLDDPNNRQLLSTIELIECSIQLPMFTSQDDWVALKLFDVLNEVHVLCLSCQEFCTEATCPRMRAGSCSDYNWITDEGYAEQVSAPVYMHKLCNWAHELINNRHVFPISPIGEYPDDFMLEVKLIFKRIFRVYAHIYLEHFNEFTSYDIPMRPANTHFNASMALNTSFLHMYLLGKEFDLLSDQESGPMMMIVTALLT
jgi:MOB kinase activator 1